MGPKLAPKWRRNMMTDLRILLLLRGPFSSSLIFYFQVVKQAVENEGYIQEYEVLSATLLRWIKETVLRLSDRDFGNSFHALQQQMTEFNVYRTQEKPPKYVLSPFYILSLF